MTHIQPAVEAQLKRVASYKRKKPFELNGYESDAIALAEALEALLLAQPKVWTAETVGEAPEGWYILWFSETDTVDGMAVSDERIWPEIYDKAEAIKSSGSWYYAQGPFKFNRAKPESELA